MTEDLQPGERVRWTENGRWFSGRVVRRVEHDVTIKGHVLPSSPAAPRWLVVTAAGDHAAHPFAAVERVSTADPRQGDLFGLGRAASAQASLISRRRSWR